MKYIVILLLISYAHADVTHNSQGTSIKVLGQSGKATITRSESITFQVDYLNELDSTGKIVGKTGATKHSINTFATQDFQFTNLISTSYQNKSVDQFDFLSPIYSIGKLKVVVMIMKQDTSVGTANETWTVSPGDVKFNIELYDWTFCNPCSDGTASYLELGLEIKGSKSVSKGNKTIDIGGGTLELSKRVNIDGSEIDTIDGYPQLITKGSKQLFVFRFPTFSDKLIYDPVINMDSTSDAFRVRPYLLLCIISILYIV